MARLPAGAWWAAALLSPATTQEALPHIRPRGVCGWVGFGLKGLGSYMVISGVGHCECAHYAVNRGAA